MLNGDGNEIFDYSLPHPATYERSGSVYTLEYFIKGTFLTMKSIAYLNDIIGRFSLSCDILRAEAVATAELGRIDLKAFQGLNSIPRPKAYDTVDVGLDNVFWYIKLHTEALIRKSGEGNLVAYSLIESFAFNNFIDATKDKSTLSAKCRSIWNWYDARGWTIPSRKGLGMSREDAGKHSAKLNADAKKAKVIGAVEALKFLQEKINIANVARQAQVSRDTAKKYLIELGLK